ncbi:DNA repair protein RecO [Hydromonas duriensis]|uniref:DNA repair protein RecO n=1 Tax=Hydromonas duriensis TaxID=1527608 RepID=A0A4R6Y8J0_9BURK|nr:DNA repair protein RecO [Hydromonas duriensis]TDR31691.1 DNA replication and repair protein RecO [Hydromonas duriensis]
MAVKIPIAKLERRKGVEMPVLKRESSMRAASKVLHEPAYILHSQPYSETSLLLDVFTRHHGRISVLAKGAKRPYTQWRASLFQTFQTLSLAYTGKAQVKTLLDLEWVGGIPMLQGAALMAGFYMNEWMRRALALDDPHSSLFDAYQHSLADLSLSPANEHAAALRGFESALLRELGYGVPLHMASGDIQADACYVLNDDGHEWLLWRETSMPQDRVWVHGQTLIDMQHNQYHATQTALESKRVLRFFLHRHIGAQPLNTRQLLINLNKLTLL